MELALIRMYKIILILFSLIIGLIGCQRQLHSHYTSAYKDGVIYFAGTDISFFQDTTFSRTDWTDEIGYGQRGRGKYLVKKRKLILQYSGFEREISNHKLSTAEKNRVVIKSYTKDSTFPIYLEVKGIDNKAIILYSVSLLNSEGIVLNNYFSDIDGTIAIDVDSLDSSYELNSQYLKSESLNFKFDTTMNLDTVIMLADHIPYIAKDRVDIYQIKSKGNYLENSKLKGEKLKFKDF